MTPFAVALCALLLSLSPAARADQVSLHIPWRQGPARAALIQPLVVDPTLSDAALAEVAASPDWRLRQQAALVLGWRQTPELFARFQVEQPLPAANGMARFRGEDLADARLAPLFLERLLERPGAAEEWALIEVLPRTGGDWAEAFVGLMAEEGDPQVRSVLAASMRWAPASAAAEGVRAALADGEGLVRGEAARAVGWRKDGAALAAELIPLLGDAEAYPRAMAARSLGYLKVTSAFEALRPLLGDPDADARLQALHAMERIDEAALKGLPEVSRLVADPDPKVARAARELR
ncbi:MAG: HEAT repeat domain-containing protein [Pseudomonadota bacterium]